jgi:hypothetical protein
VCTNANGFHIVKEAFERKKPGYVMLNRDQFEAEFSLNSTGAAMDVTKLMSPMALAVKSRTRSPWRSFASPASAAGMSSSASSTSRSILAPSDLDSQIKAYQNKIYKQLSTKLCGGLDPTYQREALERALKGGDFDIVLVAHTATMRHGVAVGDRIKAVVGFIILQKGECVKRRKAFCVKLICGTVGGIGTWLMGCALYCVYTARAQSRYSSIDDEVLLELYMGYENLSGLITYSKLGFDKDLTLWGANCFDSELNMPMKCTLDEYPSADAILDRMEGKPGAARDLAKYTDEIPLFLFYNSLKGGLKNEKDKEKMESLQQKIGETANQINRDVGGAIKKDPSADWQKLVKLMTQYQNLIKNGDNADALINSLMVMLPSLAAQLHKAPKQFQSQLGQFRSMRQSGASVLGRPSRTHRTQTKFGRRKSKPRKSRKTRKSSRKPKRSPRKSRKQSLRKSRKQSLRKSRK